jgi:hypothetical protein
MIQVEKIPIGRVSGYVLSKKNRGNLYYFVLAHPVDYTESKYVLPRKYSTFIEDAVGEFIEIENFNGKISMGIGESLKVES